MLSCRRRRIGWKYIIQKIAYKHTKDMQRKVSNIAPAAAAAEVRLTVHML